MADNGSGVKFTIECGNFVAELDKAAAKLESFGERGSKAMKEIGSSTDKMSTAQKRVYDQLVSKMKEHQAAMASTKDEYEKLRAKQQAGIKLTTEEYDKLKSLSKEWKNHAGAVATVSKELETLARSFKKVKSSETQVRTTTPQTTHTLVNLGLAAQGAKVAIDAVVASLKAFGLEQDQQIAQLAAMSRSTEDATATYRTFNNAWRDTNWDATTVTGMTRLFMNLGYSAKDAAKYVGTVADATAGLGLDQAAAQSIADILGEMQMTGEFESRDVKKIQKYGIDVGKIFGEAYGIGAEEALDAIKKKQISGTDAFKVLIDSLDKEFAGSMAKSKNNVTDQIGDVSGNIQTAAGEIGAALLRAFGATDIGNSFVNASQALVDLSRNINDTGNVYNSFVKQFGAETTDTWGGIFDVAKYTGIGALIGGIITKLAGMRSELEQLYSVSRYSELASEAQSYYDIISRATSERADIMGKDSLGDKDINRFNSLFEVIQKCQKPLSNTQGEINTLVKANKDGLTEIAASYIDAINNASVYEQEVIALKNQLAGMPKVTKEQYGAASVSNLFGTAKDKAANDVIIQQYKEWNAVNDKLTAAQEGLAAAQEALNAAKAQNIVITEASNRLEVAAAVNQRGLTAAIVDQAGAWRAGTVATGAQVKALYAAKLASARAILSLEGIKSAFVSLKLGAAAALKGIATAFATYVLNPVVLGVAALAGVIAAGVYLWNSYKSSLSKVAKESQNTTKELQKLKFEASSPAENTANIEKLHELSKEIYSESTETGKKLKELAETAKEYEQKLSIGAMTQEEYAKKMAEVNKQAEKLRNTMAGEVSKIWGNKDILDAAAALKKLNSNAEDLTETLNQIEKLDKAVGFSKRWEEDADTLEKNLKPKLNELANQIDTVKAKMMFAPDSQGMRDLEAELRDLQNEYDNTKKSIDDIRESSSYYKEILEKVRDKQLELNNKFEDGLITEEKYKEGMKYLASVADGAKSSILATSSAVITINSAMADGVLTAQEYASAIAAISSASAKVALGQKNLMKAMESGSMNDVKYWESYIASAGAEISWEKQNIANQRKHYDTYGKDGSGTKSALKGSVIGDENSKGKGGSKAEKEPKDYTKEIAAQLNKVAELRKKINSEELNAALSKAKQLIAIENETASATEKIANNRKAAQLESLKDIAVAYSDYAANIRKLDEETANTKQEYNRWSEKAADLTYKEKESRKTLYDESIKRIQAEKKAEEELLEIKLKNISLKNVANTFNSQKELAAQFEAMQQNNAFEEQIQRLKEQYHAKIMAAIQAEGEAEQANLLKKAEGIQQQIALQEQLQSVEQTMMTSLSQGITNWLTGAQSFGEMIQNVITTALSSMIQYYAELLLKETIFQNLKKTASATELAQTLAANKSIMASNAAVQAQKMAGLTAYTAAATTSAATIAAAQHAINTSLAASAATAAAAKYAAMLGPGGPALAAAEIAAASSTITAKAAAGLKDGGYIVGPGGPRDDKAGLFALSRGEYVINAAAVASVGKGNLDYLNKNGELPHYADGGVVGNSTSTAGISPSGQSVTLNVSTMDALSFQQWLDSGAVQKIKQALLNDQRNFNAAYSVF